MNFRNIVILSLLVQLLGCVTPGGGTRIDNIPMYGQPEVVRPPELKKADEEFIQQAVSKFGNRETASLAWSDQAWKYLNKGNLDYAMRRFNQAWLLDPNNYHPYWGFGSIVLEKDKADEAIKYFEKAISLVSKKEEKAVLLSDTGTAYSIKGGLLPGEKITKEAALKKADTYFKQSLELVPDNGNTYYRWAIAKYHAGDYSSAWEKLKSAENLNAKNISPEFTKALSNKMARP